ncbi:hypothetical protein Vi05172_g2236 [Venturia inaequalis]|nr:hypothetical protein Vi05172_g2236 [Venturia inaequalis]
MNLLTILLSLTSLSPTLTLCNTIRSTYCVTPQETAHWWNLSTDQTTIFKDPGKTDVTQTFCPPARKCYGGQTARIRRLDFDAENVQCMLFHQVGCVGDIKRELLAPSTELAGTEMFWTEWRSFFCWDVRLGILKDS